MQNHKEKGEENVRLFLKLIRWKLNKARTHQTAISPQEMYHPQWLRKRQTKFILSGVYAKTKSISKNVSQTLEQNVKTQRLGAETAD